MDKQQREYIHHLMLQYSDAMIRLTYRRIGDWHLAVGRGTGDLSDSVLQVGTGMRSQETGGVAL